MVGVSELKIVPNSEHQVASESLRGWANQHPIEKTVGLSHQIG